MLNRIIEAGLRPPKTLTVSITNGCNLSCEHCWPESRSESISQPVPKELLLRLIDEFARMGIERLVIAGGETLTHPDWLDIIGSSCRKPGISSVCLQTNATLLHELEVRKLASLGCAGLCIQVSLDGATQENHDLVRGKGSFERTLAGLKRLAAGGLGERTRVAFTEMRHNFDDLPMMLKIIEDLGIGGLVTGTLIQGGRAAKTDKVAPPSPFQYRELLGHYHADSAFRKRYEKLANIAAIEWHKGMNSEPYGCPCTCIENPYASADGRIYPCSLFQAEAFTVANIYERSLQEVFREALSLWSQLPKISRRRSLDLEACRQCGGRSHCGGGCMGRAYAATGTVMSVEDRCSLRKAVYSYQNDGRDPIEGLPLPIAP